MQRMSEQKYRYLYEESPSIMMIIGADGTIKDVNRALLEASGYSRSEVIGKNALDFVVPAQREKAAAQIQAALKNGEAPQFEVGIQRKDGSFCTLLLPRRQLVLEEGEQRSILVAGIDITERNLAEQALREQTRLLQKTFEAAKGAIFVLDAAIPPNIVDCNQAASEIFGYLKSEMLGKSTALLHVSDDALKQFQSLLYPASSEGRLFQLTRFKMKRKDDSIFESEHAVSPIIVDGQRVGWVSVVRDITESVNYEEKLKALHQHALLLSSANNIDEMLHATLNAMEYALGFDVADIYLTDGDSLNVKRTKGGPMGLSTENVDGRGLVAKAARSQGTVRVSDTSKEADYVDRKGWDWTGPPTMLSEIAVPMVIDGKTAGVLNVENTRPDAFDDNDQMLLETLAAHFAIQMQRLKHVQELRRSSRFLEAIIENANVWIDVLDNENNVVIWNKAAEIMSGYSREEVLGHQKIWSWLYPDDEYRKQITDSVTDVLQHGRTEQDVETNIRRKDGQTRIISWNERNVTDELGKVVGSVAIGRDITERKRMEEALANERVILRTLIDNLPDNIFVKDVESRIIISNIAHAHLLRAKTPDDIVGKTDFDIFPRELAASYYKDEQAVMRSGRSLLNREERTIDPGGKTRWLLTTKVPLRDDHGKVVGVAGINRDITERKRMQEELERYSKHLEELVQERTKKLGQSESRYRTLVENIPQKIFTKNRNLVYVSCNDRYAKDLNIMPDEIAGKTDYDFFPRELADHYRAADKRIIESGKTEEFEENYVMGGQVFFVDTIKTPTRDAEGNVTGLLGVFWDITQRKEIEEKLRESERRFRELAELLPQIVFETDEKGNFTFVNHVGLVSTGYTEDDLRGGVNLLQLVPPEEYEKVSESLARRHEGAPISLELTARRKDNSVFPALVYASSIWHERKVVGFRGIVVDITERKRMEEALLKSEKLVAIGETATMVAHDLRNPLQGIAGAAYNIRNRLRTTSDPSTKAMLAVIQDGVEYANGIINDLLEFSREMQLQRLPTTPKTVVTQALEDVKIPDNVRVEDLTTGVPRILADEPKIRRVLTNLIKNAVEAMPEGGELSISSVGSQKELSISVKDTGIGISQDELKRIWTPLHTTKAKGIGLGLSICKRIVEAHRGSISVESVVGKGTTFTLKLPIENAQGGE